MNASRPTVINLPVLVKDPMWPAAIKVLAYKMMYEDAPYIRVGEFLRNMSSLDLDMMIQCFSEATDSPDDPYTEMLFLFTLVMCQAEGTGIEGLDGVQGSQSANALLSLMVLERLARAGMVTPHYENWSLSEDAYDRVIATLPSGKRMTIRGDEPTKEGE